MRQAHCVPHASSFFRKPCDAVAAIFRHAGYDVYIDGWLESWRKGHSICLVEQRLSKRNCRFTELVKSAEVNLQIIVKRFHVEYLVNQPNFFRLVRADLSASS